MGNNNNTGFFSSPLGFALLDGGVNFATSLYNNEKAEEAADEAWKRQLSFFNMQNDYNSPTNQRKRLQEAGINPASVAGEIAGGQNAQQLSSVPQNEYAQSGMMKLNGVAETLEVLARIEKLGAETGLTTSQITSEGLRQVLLGMGMDEKRADILIKEYQAESDKIELSQLPEYFRHRNAMYDLDEQYRSAEIEHENALISLADAQSEESKESARRLVAETGLTQIKMDTERSIQSLNEQLMFKTKSETNLNRKEFGFRQITDGFRARALRLANEISASESTIKEIEAVFANIDASMYTNPDGTANWAKYTTEVLEKISAILGFSVSKGSVTTIKK